MNKKKSLKYLKNGCLVVLISIGSIMIINDIVKKNSRSSYMATNTTNKSSLQDQGNLTDITVDELKKLKEMKQDLILLDVRQPDETDQGIIPGAILIPLNELEENIKQFNKEDHIVVYCRSGRRSKSAQEKFSANNFINVSNLLGGILEWDKSKED